MLLRETLVSLGLIALLFACALIGQIA